MFQLGFTEMMCLAALLAVAFGPRHLKASLAMLAVGVALLPHTDFSSTWVVLLTLIVLHLSETWIRRAVIWAKYRTGLGENNVCR